MRFILKIGGFFFLAILLLILLLLVFVRLRAPEIKLSKSIPEIDKMREARVLTSFFGLDNGLPLWAIGLSWTAPGKDGMPVVFSQEIDPETLNVSDFEITTSNGNKYKPDAVTLRPSNEEFELRTVLLIGEYGNHPDNPPVSVKIVGDLMSRSGKNYKGQSVEVIPLEDGPVLSYAEYFKIDEDYPYVEKKRGRDCPREGTQTIVRTVWAGGVKALNGGQLGLKEMDAFQVTIIQDNETLIVKPFLLADLNDSDNNIDLCLKESGVPILVKVKDNIAIDPRGDKNPVTNAKVISRW
ncbi:MAG: hypothetical protein GY866_11290 [Proteobacteria bacterium]|nr:hypothetical protein [Pseudomonadota bacterium]